MDVLRAMSILPFPPSSFLCLWSNDIEFVWILALHILHLNALFNASVINTEDLVSSEKLDVVIVKSSVSRCAKSPTSYDYVNSL